MICDLWSLHAFKGRKPVLLHLRARVASKPADQRSDAGCMPSAAYLPRQTSAGVAALESVDHLIKKCAINLFAHAPLAHD